MSAFDPNTVVTVDRADQILRLFIQALDEIIHIRTRFELHEEEPDSGVLRVGKLLVRQIDHRDHLVAIGQSPQIDLVRLAKPAESRNMNLVWDVSLCLRQRHLSAEEKTCSHGRSGRKTCRRWLTGHGRGGSRSLDDNANTSDAEEISDCRA